MSFQKGRVDHINHNTLDNRKINLIDTTTQLNALNRKGVNVNSTTGIRNVSYDRKNNLYIVQLQVDGKNTVFGRFKDLEDARICAEENRKKYYQLNV